MQTTEWIVNAMAESNKGERQARHAGAFATKREAVRHALQIRSPDKHHITRVGRTYIVPVER